MEDNTQTAVSVSKRFTLNTIVMSLLVRSSKMRVSSIWGLWSLTLWSIIVVGGGPAALAHHGVRTTPLMDYSTVCGKLRISVGMASDGSKPALYM